MRTTKPEAANEAAVALIKSRESVNSANDSDYGDAREAYHLRVAQVEATQAVALEIRALREHLAGNALNVYVKVDEP